MFSRSHADRLFADALAALDRGAVLAARRAKDRREELGDLKREHRQIDAAVSLTKVVSDGTSKVKASSPVIDSNRFEELQRELGLLCSVQRQIVGRLRKRWREHRDDTGGAAEQQITPKPLLASLEVTLRKIRDATPALHCEMHARCESLTMALIIATIAAEQSFDGLQLISSIVSHEAMRNVRDTALNAFLGSALLCGTTIAQAPPSVVAVALTQPVYRTALAEVAVGIERAAAVEKEAPSSVTDEAVESPMRSMMGVFPAVGRSQADPRTITLWLRGVVAPMLASELDKMRFNSGVAGEILPTAQLLYTRLYHATLRPELTSLAQSCDQASQSLAASSGGEDTAAAAAAYAVAADTARTILYRVLIFINAMTKKQHSLAPLAPLLTTGSTTSVTPVTVGGGSSSLTHRGAAAHSELIELISVMAQRNGLILHETTRTTAGHKLYQLTAATEESNGAEMTVSFYVHRGVAYAARHRERDAPSIESFRRIAGTTALIKLATT